MVLLLDEYFEIEETEMYGEFFDIQVIDILGNIVFTRKKAVNDFSLNAKRFVKGTYIIQLIHKRTTLNRRVLFK